MLILEFIARSRASVPRNTLPLVKDAQHVYLPRGNCRWRFFHLEIQSTSLPFARHGYQFLAS